MTTAYLTHSSFTEHDFPRHPEHAGRITAVWEQLSTQGLLDQLQRIAPSSASDEQILAVHSRAHLDRLTAISQQDRTVRIDQDTYALPTSLKVARLAAGAVIEAVGTIAAGHAENALAVVRPPGHHATADWQMGFCLLNNIAIAARQAQVLRQCEKVLIIDYDVHHGNGTQDIFYNDPSIMFVSIHQSPFYPGSGALNETGSGAGKGFSLNVPLARGHGDACYKRIFTDVVWPLAERFAPDLMLISAGFDAHWVDPLAGMRLSLAGYDHLTRECLRMAQRLCNGKIVFVMEGGYDLNALAQGWCNIARRLLGIDTLSDPYGSPPATTSLGDIESVIDEVRRIHNL